MRNREDIDKMDKLFCEKLYDFEAETMPDDWNMIEARLPKRNIVPFYRKAIYWVAAAVVSLFLIMGSIYVVDQQPEIQQIAQTIDSIQKKQEFKVEEENIYTTELLKNEERLENPVSNVNMAPLPMLTYVDIDDSEISMQPIQTISTEVLSESENEMKVEEKQNDVAFKEAYLTRSIGDKDPEQLAMGKTLKKDKKRWQFGMGGGSVSTGTSNSINTYAFRNTSFSDVDLLSSNALNTKNDEAAKTDVDHKVPVSVGVGISYLLNDRFSLESGINYSYLRSKWKTNGLYHKTTVQKLHFLGIPLSLTYKITEWQKIRFYVSAGAMAEFNIAGKVITDSYVDQSKLCHESNSIRMDEWYWSLNARVGASYPLIRYLSLYAEVGTSYYFDNNSKIETVHSDKPFNVDLQAGLRFNF